MAVPRARAHQISHRCSLAAPPFSLLLSSEFDLKLAGVAAGNPIQEPNHCCRALCHRSLLLLFTPLKTHRCCSTSRHTAAINHNHHAIAAPHCPEITAALLARTSLLLFVAAQRRPKTAPLCLQANSLAPAPSLISLAAAALISL